MIAAYHFHWSVVFNGDTATIAWIGVKYTLLVSSLSLVFGTPIGLIAALTRMSGRFPFAQIAYIYIDFFRTTPPLVQLIWIFYVLPILIGFGLSPIASGVLALSLNAGAFLAEIFRSGLQSIDRGQHDAASVLGLSRLQTFFHVVLPQAVRNVLPDLLSNTLEVVKLTALGSVVAMPELLFQARQAQSLTYNPTPIVVAALIYFVLLWPLVRLLSRLENRALAAR